MKVWITQNAGNFLISCGTSSFLRKSLQYAAKQQ